MEKINTPNLSEYYLVSFPDSQNVQELPEAASHIIPADDGGVFADKKWLDELTKKNKDVPPQTRKRIHNIVESAILAEAMRHIRNEFMVSVRRYLRLKPEDSDLFMRAEKAAREAIEKVLLEAV